MTTVAPPLYDVWWDDAATVAAALDQLRLGGSDIDAARVAGLVAPAGARLNAYMDRTTPVPTPAPPELAYAIVQVVVELYRNKDAPPASVDGLIASAWRPASIDPLAGVRNMIAPWRERLGLA